MNFADRVSRFNRQRKYQQFMQFFTPGPQTTVLDVGYSNKEYSDSENFLERYYPHPRNITALGVVEPGEFAIRYPLVKTVMYDGAIFPFEDKQFDLCWSNAVIEHVGDTERQLLFLSEMKRVARYAYFTTPNRFFPIEVHTKLPLIHMLPKPCFDRLLHLLGKGWAAGDFMYLLGRKQLESLLHRAGVQKYTITANHICGLPMDFSVCMECS